MNAGKETEIYNQGYMHGYNDGVNARIDPDYWTRLEHQYAGMAMQAYIIGNQINPFGFCESPKDMEMCVSIAHALVQKTKEERK